MTDLGGGSGSVVFDDVADRYDATRGGMERGRSLAASLAPWVLSPVLEVGVGTGVVAAGLTERGFEVTGVDLSLPMLRHAAARVGPRVAMADGHALPVRPASIASVVAAWVLHLVPDPVALLVSCASVLPPGGRVAIVAAGGHGDDELSTVERRVGLALGRPDHETQQRDLLAWVDSAGLELVATTDTDEREFEQSPAEVADRLEQRVFSMLFDLDDATYAAVVQPAVDELRAMDEPERPRRRVQVHDLVVAARRP